MQTPVEKAIWFIESHFSQDITLDDLARVCGLSRFQMSRLFSYATGKTVTAHVRGRRLTEAAAYWPMARPTSSLSHFRPVTARMKLFHAPSGTSLASARPNSERGAIWRASRW